MILRPGSGRSIPRAEGGVLDSPYGLSGQPAWPPDAVRTDETAGRANVRDHATLHLARPGAVARARSPVGAR